jgi:3-oxoacyl-[acyl-carrier-protein] synthase III
VVLGASSEPGWLATKLAAVGEYHDALGIYTGGTARPATAETVGRLGRPSVEFVRKFRKTFNSEHWLVLIRDVLARASLADPAGRALEPNDVEWCYFTQLDLRTIEQTMAAWGQPLHKTHWIMDKWACMDSACIPMALVMPAPTAGTCGGANG